MHHGCQLLAVFGSGDEVVFAHRVEWSLPIFVSFVRICPRIDQKLDHARLAMCCCSHKGQRAFPDSFVHIDPGIDQQFHNVRAAVCRYNSIEYVNILSTSPC